jgi:hypothetical protein
MSLDIYFPEDITRVLAALSQANARNGTDTYQEALDDVAVALGLDLEVSNGRPIDGGSGNDRILPAIFSYRRGE